MQAPSTPVHSSSAFSRLVAKIRTTPGSGARSTNSSKASLALSAATNASSTSLASVSSSLSELDDGTPERPSFQAFSWDQTPARTAASSQPQRQTDEDETARPDSPALSSSSSSKFGSLSRSLGAAVVGEGGRSRLLSRSAGRDADPAASTSKGGLWNTLKSAASSSKTSLASHHSDLDELKSPPLPPTVQPVAQSQSTDFTPSVSRAGIASRRPLESISGRPATLGKARRGIFVPRPAVTTPAEVDIPNPLEEEQPSPALHNGNASESSLQSDRSPPRAHFQRPHGSLSPHSRSRSDLVPASPKHLPPERHVATSTIPPQYSQHSTLGPSTGRLGIQPMSSAVLRQRMLNGMAPLTSATPPGAAAGLSSSDDNSSPESLSQRSGASSNSSSANSLRPTLGGHARRTSLDQHSSFEHPSLAQNSRALPTSSAPLDRPLMDASSVSRKPLFEVRTDTEEVVVPRQARPPSRPSLDSSRRTSPGEDHISTTKRPSLDNGIRPLALASRGLRAMGSSNELRQTTLGSSTLSTQPTEEDSNMMRPYASRVQVPLPTSVQVSTEEASKENDLPLYQRPPSAASQHLPFPRRAASPPEEDSENAPTATASVSSTMRQRDYPNPSRAPLGEATYRATSNAPLPPQMQQQAYTSAPKDRMHAQPPSHSDPYQQAQQVSLQSRQQQQQREYHVPLRDAMSPLPPPDQPLPPKPVKKSPAPIVVNGKPYYRAGLLGKGGSSRVYRVLDTSNNLFAIKKVDISRNDAETRASFINEIDLLQKLRGKPQIIRLVDAEINDAKRVLFMVMEVGETDLNNLLIEQSGKPVSMNFIRYIWEQMLDAVQTMHDENVVHTDLKPANFVLVKGRLKLIDFGISKTIANDTTNIGRDQTIGTANYMPPEALRDSGLGMDGKKLMKLGRAADVWSLGCILHQMVYGRTPFAHIRDVGQKIMAIQNPRYVITLPSASCPVDDRGEEKRELAVNVGQDLRDAIRSCLLFDPKDRATIPELLGAPFLRREGGEATPSSPPARDPSTLAVDEMTMSVIVQRVAHMLGSRHLSDSDQALATAKLMSELRAAKGLS